MKYFVSTLFFFVLTTITAQNNFEPCSNPLSSSLWRSECLSAFTESLHQKEETIIACIITDYALTSHDEALYVVKNENSEYHLVSLELNTSKKSTPIHYRKKIPSEQAILIKDLFNVALFHVEYQPQIEEYADPTQYYLFSKFLLNETLCGYIYVTSKGNVTDFLEIIRELETHSKSANYELSDTLVTQIELLIKRFNKRNINLQDPTAEQLVKGTYTFFLD